MGSKWGARAAEHLCGPKCSRRVGLRIEGLSVEDLGHALTAAAVPPVLQGGEHPVAHGGGDVGVDVVDVLALVTEALQPQDAGDLVLDEPGLVGVSQVVLKPTSA